MLKKITGGLAAAGLVFCATSFAASGTHTLAVSANVTGNCKFVNNGPTALAISNSAGAIDPSSTTPATGSASVLFRCTTGTTSSILADNGANFAAGSRQVADLSATPNTMPYSLVVSGDVQTGNGHGSGRDLTVVFDATIAVASFENVPAGSYTDSVLLTITP